MFFGVEDKGFVLFEFGGDVSFGVGEGLFADVMLGDVIAVGTGDFYIVAEYFIEAYFEGADAGLFAFGGFEVGDPIAGVGAGVDDFIEFGGEAVANKAVFVEVVGGVFFEGVVDDLGDFGAGVEAGGEAAEGFVLVGEGLEGGNGGEGDTDLGDVAGGGEAADGAVGETFEVGDIFEGLADIGAEEAVVEGGFDEVEALIEFVGVEKGANDILAEAAGTHRGDSFVNDAEEGVVFLAVEGLGEFEVAAGGGIEGHVAAGLVGGEPLNLVDAPFLGFLEVVEEATSGAGG